MEYSDETRRYQAKVSRIGIIAAVLYALLYGALQIFTVYGFKLRFNLIMLTSGQYNVIPELAVAAVGGAALLVCGILSLALRGKPAVAQVGWIVAGKAVLLSAPVGYIRSQLLLQGLSSAQMEFLVSFGVLAVVFVGYAYGMMPRGGVADSTPRLGYRRVVRNTAIVGGIMLGAVLWLLLLTRKSYGATLQILAVEQQWDYLLWNPLNAALPVALAVTVGSLVLSLAALWDRAPKKRRIGKGEALVMWVALAVGVLDLGLLLLWQFRTIHYNVGEFYVAMRTQNWQIAAAALASLLGLWAFCRLLPALRQSKTALLGARCVLGITVLNQLLSWGMGVMQLVARSTSSGMNIDAYAKWVQAETWGHMITTLMTVAGLCILTVGLTRHLRVGKGFWAVPVLTAFTVVLSLLLGIVWELILRGTNVKTTQWLQTVLLVAVPAVIGLIRSLVGILTLTRAPAEEVPPPAGDSAEGSEPPKPRMEDYLYQL